MEVWKIIGNLLSALGAAFLLTWGVLKALKANWAEQTKREEDRNRAMVDVEREKVKGLKDFNDLRKDIEELETDIKGMKEEMFDEKKELLERLDKLRTHFEEMTKDYFRILHQNR